MSLGSPCVLDTKGNQLSFEEVRKHAIDYLNIRDLQPPLPAPAFQAIPTRAARSFQPLIKESTPHRQCEIGHEQPKNRDVRC